MMDLSVFPKSMKMTPQQNAHLKAFLDSLRTAPQQSNVINPYNCYIPNIDIDDGAAEQRLKQLRAYLALRLESAHTILIAEAPGYQGARFSGIAMTSERLLSGEEDFISAKEILGSKQPYCRTSHSEAPQKKAQRLHGFAEPTATIVWREIIRARLSQQIVLWNAFPFHPHRAGEFLTNRTPRKAEVNATHEMLHNFLRLFSVDVKLVAVGKIAQKHLTRLGHTASSLRHPANGGGGEFREGFRSLMNTSPDAA